MVTIREVGSAMRKEPHLGASQWRRYKRVKKQQLRRIIRAGAATIKDPKTGNTVEVPGLGAATMRTFVRQHWSDGDGAHTRLGFVQRIIINREDAAQRAAVLEEKGR